MHRLFAVTILSFITTLSFGQIILENNSGRLRWNAINTPGFEVVFPQGYEDEAQRVANTLQHLEGPVAFSLKTKTKPISIILQNKNSVSNGFVTLGPRRSEFFTTSPQNYNFLGTNEWLTLLSVHEYRHVVQFDKSRSGITKLASYVWGQNVQSALAFVSVPNWFWEGDAVVMETAFTESGRGRIPNFDLLMRTRNLEEGPFNYHKQYLGSFKHLVPNHYVIGYHMTSYLRNKHGYNIWNDIASRAWRLPIIPFTFSNSIKKYSGKYVVKTYNDMAADITQRWKEQQAKLTFTEFENITHRKNSRFTSYSYPHVLSDGKILAIKSGISDIAQFAILNDGKKTQRVFTPGIFNNPGFLSVGGDVIVWSEFEFNSRWRQETYSVIKTYDIKTKKYRVLTRKGRYSGPAINSSGSIVVAINNFEDGSVKLETLNAVSGSLINSFENPDKAFYSMPRWVPEKEEFVVIKHKNQRKAIVRIDANTGEETTLLNFSTENVGYPVISGDYLLFNSPISGIDNIYAINLETEERFQVTSAKYAAYNPAITPDQNIIYYNDFTNSGLDVVKMPFDPANWTPMDQVKIDPTNYFESTIEQEGHNGTLLDSIPNNEYPISRYPKGKKLLNIHSWGPYIGTGESDINLGIFTRDVLSQSRGYAGYNIDLQERTGKWTLEYSYQNLFTIIDVEGSLGNRSTSTSIRDTTGVVRTIQYDWRENGVEGGLRIPLILTNSKLNQSFNISNNVAFNNVYDFTSNYPSEDRWFLDYGRQGRGILLSNIFRTNYFLLQKTALRDINPKWGITASLDWISTPYGGDYEGGLTALAGRVYLPGFFKHHSINFYGALQTQEITADSDNYWFANRVLFPRGFSSQTWQNFYTLRTMYEFTLWNADLALGPILNIQRIRAELFYDYGYGEIGVRNQNTGIQISGSLTYNSLGTEILFDFNAFRIRALLSGGVRVVYLPDSQSTVFEIVIGNLQI